MKKVDTNVSCSELIKSTARSIVFKKDKKRKTIKASHGQTEQAK